MWPLSRTAGGNPAVMWTSEAFASTIWCRTSEKSKSGCDTEYLLEAGHAAADLRDAVLAQGQHPLFLGDGGDLGLGRVGNGHFFQLLAQAHHRVDPDPAFVTAVVAAAAAGRLERLDLAVGADPGLRERRGGDCLLYTSPSP